jgi:hypothetical protein
MLLPVRTRPAALRLDPGVIRPHGTIALRPDVSAILERSEAHQEKSQTRAGLVEDFQI